MSAATGSHSKWDVLLFGRWQGPLRNSKDVPLNSTRPEWKSVSKRERWMLSWVFVRFCDESVADVDAQRARCRPVMKVSCNSDYRNDRCSFPDALVLGTVVLERQPHQESGNS